LNCTSSAGNQLFAEGLRSCSEPSGDFLGLRPEDNDFFLSALGNSTGVMARGGVHCNDGNPPFLFKGSHSVLLEELGLELASSIFIAGNLLPGELGREFAFLTWVLMGGRGEPFTLCSSVELPFSLSSVVVVKDRILFNWVPSIDVDSSESWVTELCTLWCSNCFLLQNLISRKIMIAATTKQMKKVTATEMPIAADTCELELSCPGSIVASTVVVVPLGISSVITGKRIVVILGGLLVVAFAKENVLCKYLSDDNPAWSLTPFLEITVILYNKSDSRLDIVT